MIARLIPFFLDTEFCFIRMLALNYIVTLLSLRSGIGIYKHVKQNKDVSDYY